MRFFIGSILLVASCFAQQSTISFGPFGTWPLCEAGAFPANSPFCDTQVIPGHEPYILLVKPSSASTVAFSYEIIGVSVTDGTQRTYSGVFLSNGVNGYDSFVVVNSGSLRGVKVVVNELTSIATQTYP